MSNPFEKIKELITDAKTREALRVYREAVPIDDSEELNKILGLCQRFADNENAFLMGNINDNDYKVEKTRIGTALLTFATTYFSATKTASQSSPLDDLISKLPPPQYRNQIGAFRTRQCQSCETHSPFYKPF
jgi:Effector-associated domain 11